MKRNLLAVLLLLSVVSLVQASIVIDDYSTAFGEELWIDGSELTDTCTDITPSGALGTRTATITASGVFPEVTLQKATPNAIALSSNWIDEMTALLEYDVENVSLAGMTAIEFETVSVSGLVSPVEYTVSLSDGTAQASSTVYLSEHTPAEGNKFYSISLNDFAAVDLSSIDMITVTINAAGDSNHSPDMTIGQMTVVPEPATIAILGLGGLLLRRKRA